MPNRATHRITRTQAKFSAVIIVGVLATVLYFKDGWKSALTVLGTVGIVSVALLVAAFVLEKWLWKTKLGHLVGFPPDYSGKWEGMVDRKITRENTASPDTEIEVEIIQNGTNIEWHQKGFKEDVKIAESHFILGEVVDNKKKWSGIVGIYEVDYVQEGDSKHYGMQIVDVKADKKTIEGFYCSTKGNTGTIKLNKVGKFSKRK